MDNAFRSPTTDEKRQATTAGGVPVLASLPLVTAGRPISSPASNSSASKSTAGRRFDPPQAGHRTTRKAVPPETSTEFRTLKSELVYAPESSRPLHPHVFEWARTREQRRQFPRQETKHLPRSNPYLLPRRSLLETLSPIIRFVVIAALFAAAGTWFQMNTIRKRNADEEAQLPKTANRPAATASQPIGRPAQAPTAIGPVSSPPENSTKVGRIRDNADFARLRGDILPIPSAASSGSGSTELANTHIPRVRNSKALGNGQLRTGDSMPVAKNTNPTAEAIQGTAAHSSPAPEVASVPGVAELPAK